MPGVENIVANTLSRPPSHTAGPDNCLPSRNAGPDSCLPSHNAGPDSSPDRIAVYLPISTTPDLIAVYLPTTPDQIAVYLQWLQWLQARSGWAMPALAKTSCSVLPHRRQLPQHHCSCSSDTVTCRGRSCCVTCPKGANGLSYLRRTGGR